MDAMAVTAVGLGAVVAEGELFGQVGDGGGV